MLADDEGRGEIERFRARAESGAGPALGPITDMTGKNDDYREVELKRLLVGRGAADRMVAALGGRVQDEKRQRNHVFDTRDLRLHHARYALRLRTEGPRAFLTAKGPTRSVGASTGSKLEAETTLQPRVVEDVLAGRADSLAVLRSRVSDSAYAELWRGMEVALGGQSLQSIGHFENLRRTIPVTLESGLRLEVEIDRTRFPDGRVDDEIEIELPREELAPEVESWLDGIARAAGIETRPSTPKFARFYASLADDEP